MARIKLKYVNGFCNRDRKSQRVRYYFRRRGAQAIALPGLPGSEEFMAAYHAALAALPDESSEIGASRTSPGTINALCGRLLQIGELEQPRARYPQESTPGIVRSHRQSTCGDRCS